MYNIFKVMGLNIKKVVAKRIKLARVERDMRQSDLAEQLQVVTSYVSQIESGKINVGIETLENIASALHKPMSYFLEPFEEDENPKEKSAKTMRAKTTTVV